jgi:hypothetical protein
VEAAVLGQRGGEGKSLAARAARVGPRSCVHAQMHLINDKKIRKTFSNFFLQNGPEHVFKILILMP